MGKPFLMDNVTSRLKIALVKKGKFITKEKELSDNFSRFFLKCPYATGYNTSAPTINKRKTDTPTEKFRDYLGIRNANFQHIEINNI